MNILSNFDFFSVGVIVAVIGILGFVIFFQNRKSVTGQGFLFFSLVTIFYSLTNYLSYQASSPEVALWLTRFVIFFAVWHAFSIFNLFYFFPSEEIIFPKLYTRLLIPWVTAVSFLNLTPFVFPSLAQFSASEHIVVTQAAPGVILFFFTTLALVIAGLIFLIIKIRRAPTRLEKIQLGFILCGALVTLTSLIVGNLILPTVFNNTKFISLAGVFFLPFVALTFYAIVRYRLFHVKIITTEILTLVLAVASLFDVISSENFFTLILRASVFLLVLIFGILLIKSVIKEVKQRENLEKLTTELGAAMKQRESLVHLVTHKVKGSFTRTKYIFAGILDGTFGEVNADVKKWAAQGLDSDNMGIETVDLVLNADNLQKGSIKYDMKVVDFKDIVLKTFEYKKGPVESKGLHITTDIKEAAAGTYNVLGDAIWLKEVVHNFIENSTKYTKVGSIVVGLERLGDKVRFFIKDTGVGITEEDKKNLFTEGGRGRDSVKVNVDSTGYGLYSVKLIMDAHGGKVWAESEGEGKGATFYAEMNAAV